MVKKLFLLHASNPKIVIIFELTKKRRMGDGRNQKEDRNSRSFFSMTFGSMSETFWKSRNWLTFDR